MSNYHSLAISLAVLVIYFISSYLVRRNILSLVFHRRFWNTVLLFSFLVSGVLGLILAVSIDYKLSLEWYSTFLWLHVETGIVMALISIFHLAWHLPFFTSILRSIARR